MLNSYVGRPPLSNSPSQQLDQGLTQAEKQQRQSVPTLSHDRAGHSYAYGWSSREGARASRISEIAWGRYETAIRRWEELTGRAAPHPVEPGTKGQPRLAPAFSEWLIGLPKGFVTDLGLPYSAQHRAIGNGVVPQQAMRALWELVEMAVDGFGATARSRLATSAYSRLGQLQS